MAQATLEQDVRQIAAAEHPDPFRVLGMHRVSVGGRLRQVVRAFVPDATAVEVVDARGGGAWEMERTHPDGFWEALLPDGTGRIDYRLRVERGDGEPEERADPYAFPPMIGEEDRRLFTRGEHPRLWEVLGAHPAEVDGVGGTRFAVWAPNARRVGVVGDFNGWDGRRHPMRLHPDAGIWELFVPGVERGALYKYEIRPPHGGTVLKADPFATEAEVRPATASVVRGTGRYAWRDDEWMERRRDATLDRPISVYEVHPGSWRRVADDDDRPLGWRELADQLADYVEDAGFTHVELLPVMEHPYDPSWGYQVTGQFAPTSRFGDPNDFRYLVDHLHLRGIGVILDWVPAHFPRDEHGLYRFDGTALYEHEDPRQGEHPDWGTMVFNYGRAEVRNFLVASALYWLEEFHVDGLRVDAVASMLYLDYSRKEGEWVPNPHGGRENLEAIDLLRHLNGTVRARVPGALMIAEESTAWPGVTQAPEHGGLGFHLKWNMGWMNDFLRFMEEEPVHRKHHFNLLTFSLMYAFSERYVLPFSHDEVVHGKRSLLDKMPGDEWRKRANLRLAYGWMWTHPGKKLLFMGGEWGQWREWGEGRSLDWHLLEREEHAGLRRWVHDLNQLYRWERALWERDFSPDGFEWVDFHDREQSVVSFLRRGASAGDELLVACNFTPVPRHGYRIGVPRGGRWVELLNSDAEPYGGSGVGNQGTVEAEAVGQHGHDRSVTLTLPPLGILVMKRAPEVEQE